MTEPLHFHFSLSCIGEGNGNPLQCSCLENPRDGGACWAAVYGVTQNRTRLKRLSSSRKGFRVLCWACPVSPHSLWPGWCTSESQQIFVGQSWDSVEHSSKIRLFSSFLVVWGSFLFRFKQQVFVAWLPHARTGNRVGWKIPAVSQRISSHRAGQAVTKEINKKSINK